MTTATLFLICDTDENGDNRDLFVRSTHRSIAVRYWRSYYALTRQDKPERIMVVPDAADANNPVGPIAWPEVRQFILKK